MTSPQHVTTYKTAFTVKTDQRGQTSSKLKDSQNTPDLTPQSKPPYPGAHCLTFNEVRKLGLFIMF